MMDPLKRNRYVATIALIACFVAASAYWALNGGPPSQISPHVNNDGSVVYTLIDHTPSKFDKKVPDSAYRIWRLRIPDVAHCEKQGSDGCQSFTFLENAPRFKGKLDWPTLSFYVKYPEFIPTKLSRNRHLKFDLIRISPRFEYSEYGYLNETGTEYEDGFAASALHDIGTICRLGKKIVPNLYQLRELTVSEKQGLFAQNVRIPKRSCLIQNSPRAKDGTKITTSGGNSILSLGGGNAIQQRYHLYSSKGRILASGWCSETDNKPPHSCLFRAWVSPESIVFIDMHDNFLEQLPEIYEKTVAYLHDATIELKTVGAQINE